MGMGFLVYLTAPFCPDVLRAHLVFLATRISPLSFHTPYILEHMPVIREGCPLCVQMINSPKSLMVVVVGGVEMCHGKSM